MDNTSVAQVLVTGFEPLLDWPSNASAELVRSLEQELPEALLSFAAELSFAILPADTRTLRDEVLALLERVQPTHCLLFGQSRGRNCISIERMAQNRIEFSHPDARGAVVAGEMVDCEGPAAYLSNLGGIEQLVPALLAKGIPARYSQHAGNSLCNQVYYHVLQYAERNNGLPQTIFVHVPVLPEQVIAAWPEAPFVTLDHLRAAVAELVPACAASFEKN